MMAIAEVFMRALPINHHDGHHRAWASVVPAPTPAMAIESARLADGPTVASLRQVKCPDEPTEVVDEHLGIVPLVEHEPRRFEHTLEG